MRAISSPRRKTVQDKPYLYQQMRLAVEDVGFSLPMGSFGDPAFTFRAQDVGAWVLVVTRLDGARCFTFEEGYCI